MRVLAVIPARYASTRLPGKMLLDRTGKPLIQHVWERAKLAKKVDRVVVAVDDQRIFDAVIKFGGEAVMTRVDHANGTSRIAEAVSVVERDEETKGTRGEETKRRRDEVESGPASHSVSSSLRLSVSSYPIIVNVQGDEPDLDPGLIDCAIETMIAHDDCQVATIASPFAAGEDPSNPNIVKAVIDRSGRALYFSRALIPHHRDGGPPPPDSKPLKHVGLYVYRRSFLPTYVSLSPTPLEHAEKLEQLRVLEHGYRIAVAVREAHYHGIDTPEQYETFVTRMNG